MHRRRHKLLVPLALAGTLLACSAPETDLGISGTVRIAEVGPSPAPAASSGRFAALGTGPAFVPGEVIVRFRDALSARHAPSLQPNGRALARVRGLALPAAALYRAPGADAGQTLELVEKLERRPDVAYAQPNYLLFPQNLPDDPKYAGQWHFRAMGLPEAWDLGTGSAGTVVAVVDTGILYAPKDPARSHPDFDPDRMLSGYDFIADASLAGDGDGRDADPHDAGAGAASPYHGTHIAGTIGAWTGNGEGVAGIDWRAKLLPVRAVGAQGGTLADVLDAALWAAGIHVDGVPDNGNPAAVVNLSLGKTGGCSPLEQEVLPKIIEKGVVIVAAAGNDNMDAGYVTPANCPGVIAVGATSWWQDQRAYYSNYGDTIDVMAPGGDIRYDLTIDGAPDGVLSTSKDEATGAFDYAFYQGTSMAAAHVTGLVSLMLGLHPSLSPAQVQDILQSTARPLPDEACNSEGPGTMDQDDILTSADCGAGLVDAYAALQAVSMLPAEPPPPSPDFELSLSSELLVIEHGAQDAITVYIEAQNGFDGSVDLSVAGAPDGVSWTFAVDPATTATNLTFTAGAEVPQGRYDLVVSGTAGGGLSDTAALGLDVMAAPAPPDLADVFVIACPALTPCGADDIRQVRAANQGSSARFAFSDLERGSYRIQAVKDSNGNGRADAGEYQGFARDASGDIAQVVPPVEGLVIELVPTR